MSHENISLYKKAIDCSIDRLAEKILQTAQLVSANVSIVYRVKNHNTLGKKMSLRNLKSVFEVKDVYGYRILVPSTEEAYAILKLITDVFQSYLDHDYINYPKTRPDKPHLKGKSLKLLQVIAYKNKIPFEIQITTFQFNESNELLHDKYHCEKYKNH